MQTKERNTRENGWAKFLPADYAPYSKLILCGNTLLNVGKIIDDNGFNPLLIGENKKNNSPLVWLKSRSNNGFIYLINKSKPLVNIISVNNYSNDKQLDVILENKGEKFILLQIEYCKEIPSVTKVDLRPIGYNFYGDEDSLHIGTSTMSGNTFQADTLISF